MTEQGNGSTDSRDEPPILCLSYEYPPLGGGGSHVVAGLLRTLNVRSLLVTMGFRGLPARSRAGNTEIYRTLPVRFRRTRCSAIEMLAYLPLALHLAFRAVRETNPRLIHAHFVFPDGVIAYLLKKRTGISYVITAHGSDIPGYNPDRFRLLHRLLLPIWRRITANASAIVCASDTLKSLLLSSDSTASVVVIPNGFDADRFQPKEKQDRILVVTRMFQRKGVQHLLNAVAEAHLDYEVVIVGDGPYLNVLRAQAAEHGAKVHFEGSIENDSRRLRDLYETSRIFVLPSEIENFPMVLLEASAAGCAIVTTKGTGCDEVVGETALLVPPGDVNALKEAILQLADDRRRCEELGTAARQRLSERFDWPIVAEQYRRLFSSVGGGVRDSSGSVPGA